MVLKLRFAVGLAVLVGICTIFSGFGNEARSSTVLYRTAVSMVLFAVVGFGIGLLWEHFLREWLNRLNTTDTPVDDSIDMVEEANSAEEASFDPLTPERLENISHPKE